MKGKGGESPLEFGGGVVVGFGFGGRRGPVSFRAVKGKGGESALEFGGGVVAGFGFGGRRGPVSFRAVKLFVVAVVLSVFVLGRAWGQSASGL